jgi:hypothetical protein
MKKNLEEDDPQISQITQIKIKNKTTKKEKKSLFLIS